VVTIADVLARSRATSFVGRERELQQLDRLWGSQAPRVTFVWGIPGIGKSMLLHRWVDKGAQAKRPVRIIDARDVEPTREGFVSALTPEPGAARRANGAWEVLVIDHFDALRLIEVWLRTDWIPSLSADSKLVVAASSPPSHAWSSAGWEGLVDRIEVGPLTREDAASLAAQAGADAAVAESLYETVGGHPLALRLAAPLAPSSIPTLDAESPLDLLPQLAHRFLGALPDPADRALLESACLIRRITVPVLSRILERPNVDEQIDRLRSMAFVGMKPDGLRIHDAVRTAVAAAMKAIQPTRYQKERRAAFSALRDELRTVSREGLWRVTADLMYLLDNPGIRQAFFPTSVSATYFGAMQEPGPIEKIISAQAPAADRAPLRAWLRIVPSAVHVVHDGKDRDRAFYAVLRGLDVSTALLDEDRVLRAWMRDARRREGGAGAALFVRMMLDRERGEALGATQAACWLDVKRFYMEMRPGLRYVYAGGYELPGMGVMRHLGFEPLPPDVADVILPVRAGILDMGKGSVEGWLSRLLDEELGEAHDSLLDRDTRQVCLPEGRVDLTQLEYGVLDLLLRSRSSVVPTARILEEVWGHGPTASTSNVVQAVVRTLRKKLGSKAGALIAVRGVGYRFESA
jgi:hypothetical protein